MDFLFRPMELDDIDKIIEGETKAFGKSLGYDFIYSDLTLNPYACYIVLEIDEEIHGYVSLYISDNMEIVNLYVDKEYQGYGFGDEIMDLVDSLCIENKIANLSLEVRSSNEKAINLYTKHGLKKSHVRKQYYDNLEDAIVMVKQFEVKTDDCLRC